MLFKILYLVAVVIFFLFVRTMPENDSSEELLKKILYAVSAVCFLYGLYKLRLRDYFLDK